MADDETIDHSGDGGIDPDVEHETWRQLLFWVALAQLSVCVAVLLVSGELIPPLVVFGVLFLVGLVLLGRPGRVGPITIGVLSVLFFVITTPFNMADLGHPESFFGFFPAAVAVLASILGTIGLVGFLRRWPVRFAGVTAAVVGGLVVAVLVLGLVKTLTVTDDEARDGDLTVVAEDATFDPAELDASSGDNGVFLANQDPYRHTFVIEDLDVSVELPADTDRRVDFDAAAGEYVFHCDVPGHEDMEGTLNVR